MKLKTKEEIRKDIVVLRDRLAAQIEMFTHIEVCVLECTPEPGTHNETLGTEAYFKIKDPWSAGTLLLPVQVYGFDVSRGGKEPGYALIVEVDLLGPTCKKPEAPTIQLTGDLDSFNSEKLYQVAKHVSMLLYEYTDFVRKGSNETLRDIENDAVLNKITKEMEKMGVSSVYGETPGITMGHWDSWFDIDIRRVDKTTLLALWETFKENYKKED